MNTKETTKTMSIKMFSNAEILALNSISSTLEKMGNISIDPNTQKLIMRCVFNTLEQLDENELLKCKLSDLME